MSRSYKKNGWCKEHHVHNISKRYANKRVRNYNSEELLQNSDYKKVYESYDISDFRWYCSMEDAIAEYEESKAGRGYTWIAKKFHTLKEYLFYWYKCHKMK